MSTFLAFLRKERLEQLRTGRFLVLMLVFLLFGIMNPAIAKITPWMLDTLSSSLAESGMIITNVQVDALSSWTQFYKNIPMALILFVLMTSATFTAEYQKGTLVLTLTKGLKRVKVLAAKALIMLAVWTLGFMLCTLVTYGYTAFFWDNGIAQHLWFAAFVYYLFGVWIISIMVLFSVFSTSVTGVLLGTGGMVLLLTLLQMLPGTDTFLPTSLTGGMSLLTGAAAPKDLGWAIVISMISMVVNSVLAVIAFNRRSM